MKRADALRIVRNLHALVVEAETILSRLEAIDSALAEEPTLALLMEKTGVVRELCLVEGSIRELAQRHAPQTTVAEGYAGGVDWRSAPASFGAS